MSRSPSSRLPVLAAALATVVTGLTACGGGSDPLAAAKPEGDTIVVGSANFAENVLLAEMYAQALESKGFKALDQAGPLTINALAKGTVDAAILYSTTPEIEQRGFVALTDPKNVFGSQNIIPFIRTEAVPDKARVVLNSISKALDTMTLTTLNAKVQIDKADAGTAAKEWLQQKELL